MASAASRNWCGVGTTRSSIGTLAYAAPGARQDSSAQASTTPTSGAGNAAQGMRPSHTPSVTGTGCARRVHSRELIQAAPRYGASSQRAAMLRRPSARFWNTAVPSPA